MEVSDQIIKVLDNLGQKFGLAVDWTQSNIMPYIQQLGQRIVNYELWTSVVWIILSLILLVVSLIFFTKSIKVLKKDENDEGWFVLACISCAGIIISIIAIVFQTFDIITCLTLPEKIWMNYIQDYIQK
ncbi:hypothetical protein [Clostridium beijerinckii]|uniref:hypothetical protein n=1 Tax=Clostridium beijerinckii TaxID=1520 RepID=UPI00156FB8AB|nr:hypothetical protein [Clostridium beijerinckii]NRU52402.1 magnesium-transporting ATPase (P-type) [Clostridium beijerinckii]NYC69153.1 magnesium-transporting ATPase (P-type) [Clostridium beijerinckii]NYC91893.1 magnesium-transporting ATPase (P-type) [Clostridium beijerinckii]